MNAGSEAGAVAPVIVGLDPVRPYSRGAVEMNRNESRAAIGVRDRNTGRQRNKNVAVPRHNHAVPLGLQDPLQPLSHVERLVFLADSLARHAPAIKPAVTGIDDDRAPLAASGGMDKEQRGTGAEKSEVRAIHQKKRAAVFSWHCPAADRTTLAPGRAWTRRWERPAYRR